MKEIFYIIGFLLILGAVGGMETGTSITTGLIISLVGFGFLGAGYKLEEK